MAIGLGAFPSNFLIWLMQQNPVTYTMMERLVQACIHQLDVFEQIMVEPAMQALQEALAAIPIIVMTRQLQQSAGPDGRVEIQAGAASHTLCEARPLAAPARDPLATLRLEKL